MNSNAHIKRFIGLLSETTKENYSAIIESFDFGKIDFRRYENWELNNYTRNCFYCDECFELILICWDVGQQTAIHDHDGEDCWVYLLEGEMEEEFYKLNEDNQPILSHSQTLLQNQLTKSTNDSGFHRLKNSSKKRSVSLHIYAKPIEKSQFYDEEQEMLIEKRLSYDTYYPILNLIEIN